MNPRKKLIEVALPLDAINNASAREKSIRHGHPSTLHLWWARRPLAAARAVIFAQMVDDPSAHPRPLPDREGAGEGARSGCSASSRIWCCGRTRPTRRCLQQARDEIWQSWRRACAENADHPRAKELFDRHKLPGLPRPVRRRRLNAAGGAAARAGELRQRPQPGGRADQQGDDRDPAEVRRQAAGESRGAQARSAALQ